MDYPLFFETRDLEDKEKKKIQRHFMKRRDSGGGECGEIKQVGFKLYKICFKEEEDQERVLQRKTHTISLPSGDLCLTVSRSANESTPKPTQMTSTQELSPKPSSLQATKCLEKTSSMEISLLYYLRDNPKALKQLQKQLSCIGCTVDLNFDREIVIVKANEGGAFSDVSEKWELQVDRVLSGFQESYTCYHVLEPQTVKLVSQDGAFKGDDIKVYTESAYAVVVGEAGVVNDKIKNLERNLPTKKEVPIDERQYMLIEEEFTREIRTNLPNVKIVKSSHVLILEGLETEIQFAWATYIELIKKIQNKQVKFSPELLTFITSSGAIAKYQQCFHHNFRNPVALEASKSILVLSSLSSECLVEAEAMLKRDLSVANVVLQGYAAVPPDLDRVKELVMKEKISANVRERRIDVSFISGPNSTAKVQLVGYSEHVNHLKEVLNDYQLNQVSVQEVLNLPNAEMVDCFGKILNMIGLKPPKVTLKASHFPFPCVLVSGPRFSVHETQATLSATLPLLVSDTLEIDGPGARLYFNAEGKASKELIEKSNQVLIQEPRDVNFDRSRNVRIPRSRSVSCPGPRSLPATLPKRKKGRRTSNEVNRPLSNISVEIKLGNLVNEQVNVLVVPMLKRNLTSTEIGKTLSSKAGLSLKLKFSSALNAVKKSSLSPGGVLEVVAPPSLGCSKLLFIECLPWDGLGGNSVQALSTGLKRCLELCVQQGYTSIALPVVGPGTALKFPLREAVVVLTEKIKEFGLTSTSSTAITIHVVIKHDKTNPEEERSEETFHEVHRELGQNESARAIFRSVSSDLDDLSITVGSGIQLQLVFGDITNERTEAVVNSTDFVHFRYEGVCKDILAVAGPAVEAEVRSATVLKGEVFVTQPGRFPCQGLLHVCGENSAAMVEQLMGSIVEYCEVYEWKSVAIPAICSGNAGMDPGVVAGAILRGLNTALSIPLFSLVKVRLVFKKIKVFLAFKEEASQMFSTAVIQKLKSSQMVTPPPPPPPHPPEPAPAPPPASIDLNALCTNTSNLKSIFKFTGLSQNNILNAMKTMKELYQSQCFTQTFTKDELNRLTQGDLFTLKQLVESLGIQVHCNQADWTINGLTSDVNKVIHLVHSFMQGALAREVRKREEEDLYGRVAWCILGANGSWERLPKSANHQLEQKDVEAGIEDGQGLQWDVDVQKMEVTKKFSNYKAVLKRLDILPDFTFPLYWDNMAPEEVLKVVQLSPTSAEYKTVQEGFQQTCPSTIIKIERVQNIHLRRGYEAQKKLISDKNRQSGGANEKRLYHGTTRENCNSILNIGFNRRFSGQNATSYGQGTYFAINANYSAHPAYSKPTADETQMMFLACVLTGNFTLGNSAMKVPPPRDPQRPHDRYDTVVDKINNPNMFVVFHDNQAYPDYLITFKY